MVIWFLNIEKANRVCLSSSPTILGLAGHFHSNNTLQVIGTHIKGCQQRWKSITVEKNATLIIARESIVEDGQYAVHPLDGSNVSITNSRFNKNYIALYFDDPVGEFFLNPFQGNTMECTAGLLPHYDPQDPNDGPWSFAGIYTNGQDFLSIGGQAGFANNFNSLRNGIITDGCNLTVRNSKFQNITDNNEYGTVEGFGIHAISATGAHTLRQQGFGQTGVLSFDNCFTAIFTDGMRVEQISDNNMLNLHTGIRVENGFEDVNIQHNAIDAGAYGIRVNQANPNTHLYIGYNTLQIRNPKGYGITLDEAGLAPSGGFDFAISGNVINLHSSLSRGIRLLSVNGASVRNNDVVALDNAANFIGYMVYGSWDNALLCNTSTGLGAASGMGIYAWDAENTAWSCNQVSDSRIGLYLNMGGWSPDMFIGTNFSNHYYGLQIGNGDGINPGELGPQHHTGNRWTGSYTWAGARHESNIQAVVQNSQFIVHLTTPPYHPSVSVVPPVQENDFFKTENGTPNSQCLSLFACPEDEFTGAPPEIKEVDSLIAGGAFDSPAFQAEFRWHAERYLYRKLERHPELVVQGSVIDTFFIEKAGQPVGQFQAVRQSIQGLYDLTPEDSAAVADNFASITGSLDEIAGIDSALVSATGQDSLLLVQQRDSAIEVLDSLTQAQDTLLSGIQVQRTANAGPVIAGNNAITVTEVFEQNEQTVNDIYLNTWAKGIFTFDSVQTASLENIAFQCPLTGGSAVFRARSLLLSAGEYDFGDDDVNCQGIGQRNSIDEGEFSDENNIKLYPNPTTGIVQVEWPVPSARGYIVLIDSYGKVVMEQRFSETSRVSFQTGQLPSGVYMFRVHFDDRRSHTLRVIVMR